MAEGSGRAEPAQRNGTPEHRGRHAEPARSTDKDEIPAPWRTPAVPMEVRVMLSGESIRLRPVREDDLAELYARHVEIADRGAHFPLGVLSEPAFRRAFQEEGFWTPDEGMLVVTDERGTIVGHVEFYRTVKYLDEAELSYQIYGDGNRGKGYATEAVALMTRYLFEHTKVNRIRLLIHPENAASRRVAEKARFSFESIAEGIWHHRGRNEDLAVYVALRDRFLASG